MCFHFWRKRHQSTKFGLTISEASTQAEALDKTQEREDGIKLEEQEGISATGSNLGRACLACISCSSEAELVPGAGSLVPNSTINVVPR